MIRKSGDAHGLDGATEAFCYIPTNSIRLPSTIANQGEYAVKMSQGFGFAPSVLLAGLLIFAAPSGQALSADDTAQKGSRPTESGQANVVHGYYRASAPSKGQLRGASNIVVIDNIDFVPNPDFTGGSILWVDGSTCDCDVAPFNLNVYGTATTLQFFWPNNANGSEGGVSLDAGTTYAVLDLGATIGPASTFLVGTGSALTAPWSVPGNVDGYLGFRFLDDGITKYGYTHITTGTNGRPLTIHSVVYNNVGDAITIGASFDVGGTVDGLSGSGLVLQNNGGDDLPIAADGPFTFATPIDDGDAYDVTVLTQPESPSQTCSVTNGAGMVSGADVNDVEVSCVTDTFTVGGTVTGLSGIGLVLQNNGGDNLAIAADGAFAFTAQDDGTAYNVTVLTQPGSPSQTCSVTNPSGTLDGANVTDVLVTCVDEPPVLSLSTAVLDFGIVNVGDSISDTVTITNTGTGDLIISGISDPDAPFAITGGSCLLLTITLLPTESCDIEVTFTPTSQLVAFSSQIVIDSNAASSPDTIAVLGNGAGQPVSIPVLGRLGLALLILMLAGLAWRSTQLRKHESA